MEMERGKLYRLDAPYHRAHGTDVLVMSVEEGVTEARSGKQIAMVLERPFDQEAVPNWSDEFLAEELSESPRWPVLRAILTHQNIGGVIRIIHEQDDLATNDYDEEETPDFVDPEDFSILVNESGELVINTSDMEDAGSAVALTELIYVLQYFNEDEDGSLMFFDFNNNK